MNISKPGLNIQLGEGQPQAQTSANQPVSSGEPLSPEEIEAILNRLPDLPVETNLQTGFQLAQQPIPPPRPGQTVAIPFPPDSQQPAAPAVPTGPLQVLRFAPEGDIPLAPFVSVTFNQPMVALTTLENLSAQDVPLKIEPALEGTWRWLGVQTLTFETDSEFIDRLPKATIFRASVPAGTKSLSGGVLAQTVEWTFRTPPPAIVDKYPVDIPQPVDPLIFIAFDQRIDPAAVLETIQVQADGQDVELTLAKDEEIQANDTLKNLVKNTADGRWLAFRPLKDLPSDSAISVTVGPENSFRRGAVDHYPGTDLWFPYLRPLARGGSRLRLGRR